MRQNGYAVMLNGATATGAGDVHPLKGAKATFIAQGEVSASTGSATILIEVSNDPAPSTSTSGDGLADWITAGTITLSLTTTMSSDGFAINAPYMWARARVSAISGTDATVTCWKASEV